MSLKAMSSGVCLILVILFFSGCIENNDDELNTLYVDDDGGFDFTKIQDAIDAATEGNIIIVRDGTYYEVLSINKTIQLRGTNKETTIIDNQNKAEKSVVTIDAKSCVFKNFTVKGPTTTNQTIAINVNTSDNVISNNIIMNADSGIYLGPDTENNSVYENNLKNNNYGISTQNSHKNVISNNELSYDNRYGIYLSGSNNNKISDNSVSHCGTGIRIKSSDSTLVFDNVIFENRNGLLCCCGAGNNKIYHNNFTQNQDYNGRDDIHNYWDNGTIGNYWDDYIEKYPNANKIDGIWDTPYEITSPNTEERKYDHYPLVDSI